MSTSHSPGVSTTRREQFHDPIRREMVTLVIPAGGRIYATGGEPKIGVEHPGCTELADLAVDLDAFYCRACQWSGRVSGAWAVERIKGHLHPEDDAT